MRMAGVFRGFARSVCAVGLSFAATSAAWAIAPIGAPNASEVIYRCTLSDHLLLSTMMHPVAVNENVLWITTNSSQSFSAPWEGAFTWHYPHSDMQMMGFYRKVLDFDVYGRATRQLVVGPDGKARYSAAYLDDDGNSRFETYDMTCEKGEAY